MLKVQKTLIIRNSLHLFKNPRIITNAFNLSSSSSFHTSSSLQSKIEIPKPIRGKVTMETAHGLNTTLMMRLMQKVSSSRIFSERKKLEWYPPFFLMRVKVLQLTNRWRKVRLKLPLNIFSRNPGGGKLVDVLLCFLWIMTFLPVKVLTKICIPLISIPNEE